MGPDTKGPSLAERLGLGRPELRAWAMYDWANSAFVTTIVAAVFPIYYGTVAAADLSEAAAMYRYGMATTIALAVVAVLAPPLGRLPTSPARRSGFSPFSGIGVAATSSMFFIYRGDWPLALGLFVVANIGISGAFTFYDSLLPHIARKMSWIRYPPRATPSATWRRAPPCLESPLDPEAGVVRACRLRGSLPAFFSECCRVVVSLLHPALPKGPGADRRFRAGEHATAGSSPRPSAAWAELFGICAASDRPFSCSSLFWSIMTGSIPSFAWPPCTERRSGSPAPPHCRAPSGPVRWRALRLPLRAGGGVGGAEEGHLLLPCVYVVVSILGYFMRTALHFYLLSILVATVQGGSQALSRSLFAAMIPRQKSAEFFGFFAVFEKFAGIIGPLVFASAVGATGRAGLRCCRWRHSL